MRRAVVLTVALVLALSLMPSASAVYRGQNCDLVTQSSSKSVWVCIVVNDHDSQPKVEPVGWWYENEGNSYQIYIQQMWIEKHGGGTCYGVCILQVYSPHRWENIFTTVEQDSPAWWLGCSAIINEYGDGNNLVAVMSYKIKWTSSGPTTALRYISSGSVDAAC